MVKIKRIASDLRGTPKIQKDNCFNNSGYKISTDRLSQQSVIQEVKDLNPPACRAITCPYPHPKNSQTYIREHSVFDRVNRMSSGLDSKHKLIVSSRAGVDTVETPLPESSNVTEKVRNDPDGTFRNTLDTMYDNSSGQEFHQDVGRREEFRLKKADEASSTSVESGELKAKRRLNYKDRSQSALPHEDQSPESYNRHTYRQRRSSRSYHQGPIIYNNGPFTENNPAQDMCLWHSFNSNNRTSRGSLVYRNPDPSFSEWAQNKQTDEAVSYTYRGDVSSRRKRGSISAQPREPSVVYVYDKSCVIDDGRNPKTTVYLCNVTDHVTCKASPKIIDSDSVIGTRRDIAPPQNANPQYVICTANDIDQSFNESDSQNYPVPTPYCKTCCKVYNCNLCPQVCRREPSSYCMANFLWILCTAICGICRWIVVFIIFLIMLFLLLTFINLNNIGFHCTLCIIVLLLYILVVSPDNLMVYYYIKQPDTSKK